MEIYLTIGELAAYLKIAEQTIRRWVLNREIPFHKIRKAVRFRVSEIEKWVDGGGIHTAPEGGETETETGETDGTAENAASENNMMNGGNI